MDAESRRTLALWTLQSEVSGEIDSATLNCAEQVGSGHTEVDIISPVFQPGSNSKLENHEVSQIEFGETREEEMTTTNMNEQIHYLIKISLQLIEKWRQMAIDIGPIILNIPPHRMAKAFLLTLFPLEKTTGSPVDVAGASRFQLRADQLTDILV